MSDTTSTSDQIGFAQPAWWKSRKFWSAVATSAALWAVAVASGGITVPTAILASAPLLGWIGVEGAVDVVRAAKK